MKCERKGLPSPLHSMSRIVVTNYQLSRYKVVTSPNHKNLHLIAFQNERKVIFIQRFRVFHHAKSKQQQPTNKKLT